MLRYIIKRTLWMLPSLIAISFLAFILIQLPAGDYVTAYVAKQAAAGQDVEPATIAALREQFGLNRPMLVQYFDWISDILLRGDFGMSFEWQQSVNELIGERMLLTVILAFATLAGTWVLALPLGIYSAVRKYSVGDYVLNAITFVGLALPNFLLALVAMYIAVMYFNADVGSLFSPAYERAPWSVAKVWDLITHLWLPVSILAVSGTASLVRIMRANMMDELRKPYVTTARAKGLSEMRLLFKYPLRLALNPFISTIPWVLPTLVSGSIVVAITLNLPTAGPILLNALVGQDMYLAGAFVLMICLLTLLGSLISDILLALVDPRIRLNAR
ncbi:MAG: ABC transporter permease [Pelagibacterium sp. SCN 64-44]|nr:MAG: ABC transporter permease [Pelagibacterium sp. SCN 64-44]